MEITKEIRERVLTEVKAAAQQKFQYGKQRVPMSIRQEIADRNGVSLSFVTSLVTEAGLTYQRQWKPEERRDIWLNYERIGSKALAERYEVTQRAIIQQVLLMRKVEATTPNPWQKV